MPGRRTQRPRRGAVAAVASHVPAEPTVVKPKRQQKPRRFGCATLTAKKPCATELVAIASAKTEAARVARQRQQRAKKQTPKRTTRAAPAGRNCYPAVPPVRENMSSMIDIVAPISCDASPSSTVSKYRSTRLYAPVVSFLSM